MNLPIPTSPARPVLEVAAPVRVVILFEDRALVSRRVTADLPEGFGRVRIKDVAPVISDRTLVSRPGEGLRVDEMKVLRRWRLGADEQPPAAAELARELLRLEAALVEGSERLEVGKQRRALLHDSSRLFIDGVNRELQFATEFKPSWESELDELYRQLSEQDLENLDASHRLESLDREREAVRMRQHHGFRPSEILECELQIDLEAPKAGRYVFDVEYLVPCALWRPLHRATLTGEQLRFECEAAVWQNTGEDWTDAELRFSTARSSQYADPPLLQDDWLGVKKREEKKVTVRVRNEAIATTGEGAAAAGARGLPGVDDGGESRLFESATRTTVLSDGRMRRVPAFQFTASAQLELVACPELEPLVHTRVRASNTSPHPVLAGPVDLARASGYVGRSKVGFIAPGENLVLGFGSEDGLRVRRDAWASEEHAKLTGRQLIKRHVELHLSNLDDRSASFKVQERIPVSETDKVKIELVRKETSPAPASVDDQGIVTWDVVLGPHQTDQIKLVFEVNASSDVQGLGGGSFG